MKKREMNPSLEKEKVGRHRKVRLMPILLILFGSMLFSVSSYGQQKKLNFTWKETPLEGVLKVLERSDTYKFVFNYEDVKAYKVTAEVKGKSVTEILDIVLQGLPFSYHVVGDYITIRRKSGSVEQWRWISGNVKDEQKVPLPGVTVMVKNMKVGGATDKDGNYKIGIPAGMEHFVLVFSFIGMETKEVAYAGKDTINVMMKESSEVLEEVVKTGYQAVKEKGVAGSYTKVKAEDLLITGNETLEQMLQGLVPGMMVINQSGLTGTRQKVRVRGTSTLLGNADPVWVVDGIIQEDKVPFQMDVFNTIGDNNVDMMKDFVGSAVSWLNPNDIEDITILKDASATAIYGVKAANGVIVITTKKGQRGRMSLNYSGNFTTSVRMNYNKLEIMNSKERVELSREGYERGAKMRDETIGYTGLALAYERQEISLDEFTRRAKELETMNTDWFDILYRTPFTQTHSISFSGGDEKSTYRTSFGYSDIKNTAKGNGQTSYFGSLNMDVILWNQLTLSSSLSGDHTETTAFADGVDPFGYALNTSRVLTPYGKDGKLQYYEKNAYDYNILNELANSGNTNKSRSLILNLNARWVVTENLTFSLTLGGGSSATFAETWFTERSNRIAMERGYNFGEYTAVDKPYQDSKLPIGGMQTVLENHNFNYTTRFQVKYVKLVNKHSINAMGGVEARSNQNEGFAQTNWGYQPDRGKSFANVPLETPSGALNYSYTRSKPTITDQISNYFSYYLSAGYMYDNRYSINLSLRGDSSNRFGQDTKHRFQPVWSLGLRWNVTDERWMKNQSLVSTLDITGTLGYQGNVAENISPDLICRYDDMIESTGEAKLTISKRPTPDLKWEKTLTTNLGINFGFFKNRINGVFNYYYKKTRDVITQRNVPSENGVLSMYINGGSLTNTGWDLSLSVIPVRTRDFMWSISTSFSRNDNKVKSAVEPIQSWDDARRGEKVKEGYPVGAFWAFRFKGLDHDNGGPLFDLTGADTNEALLDATTYMVYAGSLEPKSNIGFNMVFRWKRFSIPLGIYYVRGNKTFLSSPYTTPNNMPSEYQNASTQLLKRWRKPGDERFTDIPSIPVGDNCAPLKPFVNGDELNPYDAWKYSDIRVVDAWFIRFNNFSLSYNLPEKWISGFAQALMFTFSASNPWQIKSKDFKGRDPEVALGKQPRTQNFSFGVNVTF